LANATAASAIDSLVLAAPCGQAILHCFQRLGETGDVAVSEDAEHAREQRSLRPSISVLCAHK
jgi:hypothetical protein